MGYDFVCVISNGHIYCMGKNDQGQLGNNSRVDSLKPVQVLGL
jgi:alpha-tubulin suppressor-like RCC1 family protein